MKRLFRLLAIIINALLPWNISYGEVFNTSKSFDLLCLSQYIDHIKDDARFAELCSDSVFIAYVSEVNSNCSASKLCNLYSEIHGDKDDITKCLFTIQHLDSLARGVEWAKSILSVQPQLSYICHKLVEHGYSDYWDNTVYPKLKSHIDNYNLNKDLLNKINKSLADFFLPEFLSDTRPKIYILDIENAFNLSDESFCCTPLILNPEIERRLRLNFMNIYIHENLHNLHISPELMEKLNELDSDSFYRINEDTAQAHGEGRNEAFVVAAEVFISHNLGIRDNQNVFDEFSQYVDGSLVLAPIIYVNLSNRMPDESYNDFLIRLFDEGTLRAGAIKDTYDKAMTSIQSKIAE
ncbi:MAG: hypothetical protein J6J93_05465 [Muribaculaceae bacterium]|nr:hypothetical protein [Muribaculaceae bacterium]